MLKPPAPLADATSSLSDARLIRKRGGVVFIRPRLENISREMERRRKTPSSLLFRKLVRKLCSLNRANKIPYPILAARRDVDFKAFRKAVPSFFRNEAISTRRETRPIPEWRDEPLELKVINPCVQFAFSFHRRDPPPSPDINVNEKIIVNGITLR